MEVTMFIILKLIIAHLRDHKGEINSGEILKSVCGAYHSARGDAMRNKTAAAVSVFKDGSRSTTKEKYTQVWIKLINQRERSKSQNLYPGR